LHVAAVRQPAKAARRRTPRIPRLSSLREHRWSATERAVAPPLLPPPFALVSKWLPSGATVTALREAVYFPAYQHAHPIVVLATWATVLSAAMLVVSHRLGRSPGDP
jgi:hypothetical protein